LKNEKAWTNDTNMMKFIFKVKVKVEKTVPHDGTSNHYHITEDSFGFSVTCNVSGVFAWFWQFLVGRLIPSNNNNNNNNNNNSHKLQ